MSELSKERMERKRKKSPFGKLKFAACKKIFVVCACSIFLIDVNYKKIGSGV